MSQNYRGLIWGLVAIAGTATVAAVTYRYATRRSRRARAQEEPENELLVTNAVPLNEVGSPRLNQERAQVQNEVIEDVDHQHQYQNQDQVLQPTVQEVVDSEIQTSNMQRMQQQLVLVTREGNLLLSVFGLSLMLLVGFVSMILVLTSEDVTSPAQLQMFPPLMWIAIGIFTAASVEAVSQTTVATPQVQVKDVFPSDESDFEMIERYNGPSNQVPQQRVTSPSNARSPRNRRANHNKEQEQPKSPARTPTDAATAAAGAKAVVGSIAAASRHDAQADKKDETINDVETLVGIAESLFEEAKHDEIYQQLKLFLPTFSNEIELLWRLARACNYLSEEKKDPIEKKALAFEGLKYAEKAYEMDPNSATANKWMAIMTSTVGNFRETKEKIAGAYVIRDHIKRAIELDPEDATSHNILGQWCLAFADLSWFEKKAAAALFGKPPSATYDDALQHFLAAEKISPGFWKKNTFLVAQTYFKMKNENEARTWLLKAKAVPVTTPEDRQVQNDIEKLAANVA